MTKKQYHQFINKSFYEMINQLYPEYELDFSEPGGLVTLIPKSDMRAANMMIFYHQSQHYVISHSYSINETKQHNQEMTKWLEEFMLNHCPIGLA